MEAPLVADDSASSPSSDGGEKTVFVVRHAESLQNVAMRRVAHCDCTALPSLCILGQDPGLSAAGSAQLEAAAAGARALAATRRIELVAHSPLVRARQTAERLFGDGDAPLVEVSESYELTVGEALCCCGSGMHTRVEAVERWLLRRPERTIALVAHEMFLQRALRRSARIPNVGFIECRADPTTGRLRAVGDVAVETMDRDAEHLV